ncbi:MAG TPA: type II secretion system major pseudopilin GspG [Candidatus Binatia bacterium]|jgi:general secretion pathway protein G
MKERKGDTSDRGQRGFTLIELLMVMVILGLLAAVVGPNIFRQAVSARIKTTKLQIAEIVQALDHLALDTGRYPSDGEGLGALMTQPSDMEQWDGPYMKRLPKDAWNHEFIYHLGGGRDASSPYVVISGGADGREGGGDDISSAE